MDITGIVFLSGKPGLYKVITKRKNELVAESIPDGKRLFVYALDKVSALEDISIYTYDDDVPLKDVFAKLYKIEEGKKSIPHKSDINVLRAKMEEILPDYDVDRVYNSDLKKFFQWYNILIEADLLHVEETVEEKPDNKSTKE